MSKLLEMPKERKLYDAWMQEYQARKKYDRETAQKAESKSIRQSIAYGFFLAGVAFIVGFAMYWIIRLRT
jgi:ribonucleotide reductase beta subunit family protein with ferritin-like domain